MRVQRLPTALLLLPCLQLCRAGMFGVSVKEAAQSKIYHFSLMGASPLMKIEIARRSPGPLSRSEADMMRKSLESLALDPPD
jgi:hypothetical protein